jgi:hypothetical protein
MVIMISIAPAAHAQVNVESLRRDLREVPARGSIAATFTGRAGNVESVEAGASALGAARVGRHTFLGSTQADYGRFERATTVSKTFVHLRYDYTLLSWLMAELFVQQQQDRFQRLLLRELAGTGPRFVLVDDARVRVAVGLAAMLEYERIRVAPGAPDDPDVLAGRFSGYATGLWQPDWRVRAVATLYVQPRMDAWHDVRVLFDGTLETRITKRASVKIIASMRHDSEPPTAVKRTDVEIKNALSLEF